MDIQFVICFLHKVCPVLIHRTDNHLSKLIVFHCSITIQIKSFEGILDINLWYINTIDLDGTAKLLI
jgi:hypothetical protein